MEPAQDVEHGSGWRALVRPTLARAVASGLAMGAAAFPAALILSFPVVPGPGAPRGLALDALAGLTAAAVVIGALGGAPGAALEARSRELGRGHLVTAVACGLLFPSVALLLAIQVTYAMGVLDGGVEQGLGRIVELTVGTGAGWQVAPWVGLFVGLTLPLTHVVWWRLAEPASMVLRQILGGMGLVFGEAMALAVGNGVAHNRTIESAIAALVVIGLAMAALFPIALALADRFGRPGVTPD